jgi:hypothetical protein
MKDCGCGATAYPFRTRSRRTRHHAYGHFPRRSSSILLRHSRTNTGMVIISASAAHMMSVIFTTFLML